MQETKDVGSNYNTLISNDDKKTNKKKVKVNKLIAYNYHCTMYRNSSFTIKLLKYKTKSSDEIMVKEYKKSFILSSKLIDTFMNEVEVLTRLRRSDLVLQILFPLQTKSNICIAFKKTNTYINNFEKLLKKNTKFNLQHAKFYTANFLLMFEYFLENNILFRGFNYEAILIDKNGYLVYSSVGTCKILKNRKDLTYTIVNAPEYLAPEMINYEGYSYKSNYFVLGIIIYELLHGVNPFVDENDPMITYKNITKGNYKQISTDRDAKAIIEQLLTVKVANRLGCKERGINEITYNKWFLNFDWEAFCLRTMPPPIYPMDPENLEEYYNSNAPNSPEMSTILSLKDKPWKEINEQVLLGNPGLAETKDDFDAFDFMDQYDNYK